jgi:osmotically-inducible protein OsmY
MQGRAFLSNEVESALALEPRISGKIAVEVEDRTVRLTGFVETLAQKEIAEAIARRFGPVKLENDIAIESPKIIEDREILESSQQMIADRPELARAIGVGRVVDGVAYLKGHAESIAEISEATNILANTPGMKDIVSEVKVSPDIPTTDEDIVSGVKQALYAEPSIHHEFIGATAKGGVVVLDGVVDTIKEKLLIGSIVKRLPGVVSVHNAISTNESPTSLDQAVENQILKALAMSHVNIVDVRITVLDGLAYLDGTVDSYTQRERARRITEAVLGVSGVQNDLVIGFHIEKSA